MYSLYSRPVGAFLLIALVSLPVHAAAQSRNQVPPGVPFQALLDEINALKARVAKLESGQVDAATMVGRYAVQLLGIELSGNPAAVSVEIGRFTITLHSNFEVTFAGDDPGVACTLRQGPSWVVSCGPTADSPESGITWRVENGMLVLSENGNDFSTALIGAGAQFLVAGEAHQLQVDAPRTGSWSNVVIAVRLPQ